MSSDLARALDPALIARDVGLTLDQWQAELLRSTAPRTLILASRQVGKTASTALAACGHRAKQAGRADIDLEQ